MTYKEAYEHAHYKYKLKHFSAIVSDGFYCKPKMPKVNTANGLTQFIVNYIDWIGFHANRISSAGRFIPSPDKFDAGIFIPSTTKNGTADVMSIVNGKAIAWEVKIGKDRASSDQLKQQAQIEAAGGFYYFVSTPDEFLTLLKKHL